jgi:hypothetical protein
MDNGVIDCTPTWEGLLPFLAEVFKPCDPKDELRRMARIADEHVALFKDGKLTQLIHELMEFTPEDERESFEKRLKEVGL